MTDDFYPSIQPVDSFESLALRESYSPLPTGWAVVAADVVSSTRAIREGRYKEVNTIGVSVIAATRNAVRPVEVPYLFGGDGAVVCVPQRLAPVVREALAATVAMAQGSFGLELRAALVPIEHLRGQGHEILVARHRVSAHYVQCAFFGGGAVHVERALKSGELPERFLITADRAATADFGGLECRWSEIPSPGEETVAVIVEARGRPDDALATYRKVMGRVRAIYGDADACRPVAEEGLRVTLSSRVLRNEARLRTWNAGALPRLAVWIRLRYHVILGWILLRLGVRTGATDWRAYRRDLVTNTDFRKFDGTVRLVLAGTATQRGELQAYLAGMRDAGAIAHGVHVARSAIMTCLVEKRQGAHFHFVDAAEGGYAAAARELKGP